MDDIVKRLRDRAAEQRRNNSYLADAAMDDEAAAEIDRLRAALETISYNGVSQQEYVMFGPAAFIRIARAALQPIE